MARAARDARLHAWLLAPALAVFTAFWLLPLTRLAVVGWSGPQGLSAYFAVVTNAQYFRSLVSTVVLSLGVTAATLTFLVWFRQRQ